MNADTIDQGKTEPVAIQTVRLHVGAHKTATTYIQETLLLNRAESAAAGTAFWPVHSVRATLRAVRQEAGANKNGGWQAPWSKPSNPVKTATEQIEELFVSGYDVTISEENILGNADDCYKTPFYRRASPTLRLFAQAIEDRRVEVYLAVRSYAPFLASIYAESLRHGMFTSPQRMMATNASCAGQWLQVIDTIQDTLPNAKMIVWQYEDFAKLQETILARLSGLPAQSIKRPSSENILPSSSKEAIEHMIAQAGPLERTQRIFRMLALNAQYPRIASKGGKFMPFSSEDQARLQSEYETDLAAIEARDDITLLS